MLRRVAKALALASFLIPAMPADAMSVQAFHAMSDHDQGQWLADYMLKVKANLARTDPAFAQAVWEYFVKDVPGKPGSQGLEDMLVQELVIDRYAKQGKADPSKIEIESVIGYVIRQHFPRSASTH